MVYELKFSRYNECSILIEWPLYIDEKMLKFILSSKTKIEINYIKQNIEVINTYNSILIIYDSTIDVINDEYLKLKTLISQVSKSCHIKSVTWKIPVCYDLEFGVDLEFFSIRKKASISQIIELHSKTIYTVYFLGFLPGFLYLGGLDTALHLDRKTTPNLNVKKGAIGIGGKQTGIYPQDSPGGWHIIGNSPIELFNSTQNPPCFIKAGDKVKFQSISKSEYFKIQNQIETSVFDINNLLLND